MELALFLTLTFAITAGVGLGLERIRVPWLFAALLLGLVISFWNPFPEASHSFHFQFLAELGMYFFLFVVGFEMNLEQVFKEGKFIISAALVINLLEAAAGSVFIHYVFGTSWPVAAIVGLSFATVGEALLLPIFKEFKMVKTDLGQMIFGVGLVDNIFEILAVVLVSLLLITGGGSGGGESVKNQMENQQVSSSAAQSQPELSQETGDQSNDRKTKTKHSIGSLARSPVKMTGFRVFNAIASLFALTWLLRRITPETTDRMMKLFKVTRPKEVAFALSLVVFFGFIYIGSFAEAGALGALLAGLAVKPLIPGAIEEGVADDVRMAAYGIFGPPFFLSVGLEANVNYLIHHIPIVVALVLLVKSMKVISSILVGYKKLGIKKSVVMGVSLSVKFSTSLVIIKLLLHTGQISAELFSVLVATKILFKFIIPFLLAWMLSQWDVGQEADTA
jgi:Kef-type K+ transport system membrane component KefB